MLRHAAELGAEVGREHRLMAGVVQLGLQGQAVGLPALVAMHDEHSCVVVVHRRVRLHHQRLLVHAHILPRRRAELHAVLVRRDRPGGPVALLDDEAVRLRLVARGVELVGALVAADVLPCVRAEVHRVPVADRPLLVGADGELLPNALVRPSRLDVVALHVPIVPPCEAADVHVVLVRKARVLDVAQRGRAQLAHDGHPRVRHVRVRERRLDGVVGDVHVGLGVQPHAAEQAAQPPEVLVLQV
mmetsp:Transcript_11955/g.18316  ORF Transcript_11955/g.18316 Transcript_11955/m.18316 type:complete len:244 (-) Transcript_11955:179-910(-)